MDSDRVIARLRRGYDAFNRGDMEAVFADLSPRIELRERAETPDPRHASGREEAFAAIRALQEDFEDYRFEPREFHVAGDHVLVLLRQSGRGRRSGVPVEGDIVHAWEVDARDRAVGLRAFSTLGEARAWLASRRA